MLEDLLKDKKCFKLICGAGNEDLNEIKNLVAIFASAGCKFFDLNASEKVLNSAQEGLDFSVSKENQSDYNFCISVGTKNDLHLNKAKIFNDLCKKCGKCSNICPQLAINDEFIIDEKKCIGCQKCFKICTEGAIKMFSKYLPISEIFGKIKFKKHKNLNCVELHTNGENTDEIRENWQYLCENFNGMLSLCISLSKLNQKRVLALLKELICLKKPYSVIIQADGVSMSGGSDDIETTRAAILASEIIMKSDFPVFILPSGGTNSKTKKLAELNNININGVAMGSFARKTVQNYILDENLLENKQKFIEAVSLAKNLMIKSGF